jgi:hypothetical protein
VLWISAAALANKGAPNATIYNDLGTANYGSISIPNLAAYCVSPTPVTNKNSANLHKCDRNTQKKIFPAFESRLA